METRILIPTALRVVVTDNGKKDASTRFNYHSGTEEESEEKPSSSSGHCETLEEDDDETVQISKSKRKHSSAGKEECTNYTKSNLKLSSSSTSSYSPSSSDSSASSENEAEVENCLGKYSKSEGIVASSSNHESSSKSKKSMETNKGIVKEFSQVKIVATRTIETGTVFSPNDGDVQVVQLKEIPQIPKDDIRFIFGCFETITPIPSPISPTSSSPGSNPLISPASTTTSSTTATSPPLREEKQKVESKNACSFVRLCNWIRFLRCTSQESTDSDEESMMDVCKIEQNVVGKDEQRRVLRAKRMSGADYPNFDNDSSKTPPVSTEERGASGNNVIARLVDGRPVFEVVDRLVPGTELVVRFDMDSVLSYASTRSPSYMTKMSNTKDSSPVASVSSSPPPAPFFSSTCITRSSPVPFNTAGTIKSTGNFGHGEGVKKERDEKEPALQHHHQQRQFPVFPYTFHNIYSSLENNTPVGNAAAFQFWPNNGLRNIKFGKNVRGVSSERKKQEDSLTNSYGTIAEGPLDLSKLQDFRREVKTPIKEPLKVGTPFDSPDSNDDDMVKSVSSPETTGESRDSTLFSIRNVLKRQSSEPSSKLFQPYSLDIGQKVNGRETLLKALTAQNSTPGLLLTPPSSSDASLRNATGLRPILRTRGRERSLLPCEVCGKAFDRPSLLKRHLRTHTGEKPHVCDVCSKGFSTSSSLNTHRRIHSGEKPHQCPICGKRFTASSNLYYHRMTHNKEKPHKCMLCGKSFPTPGDLKSHQYVHSGSWPYTCPVCHRGFSKQTNLRNHLLLHSGMTSSSASSNKSGEKPHTCHICDKKFAQACNLRTHIKTHEESEASPSNCSICNRSFSAGMLLNGQCRNCLLTQKGNIAYLSGHRRESTSSPKVSCTSNPTMEMATGEKVKEGCSSTNFDVPSLLSSHRMVSTVGTPAQSSMSLAPSVGHFGLPIAQFPGLAGIQGLSSALSFASTTGNVNFHMNPTSSPTADLFVNAGTAPPARNALLEQLFEWNYRMAKESVGIGSLGFNIMQQKLLESRMLAAQLMNTHGFGMNGGIQDLLGLRSAGVPSESDYMQR